ncbi:flavonoid 3'-monooxygenase [Magnolia sinica]|uniref:flavonoid 3'-monooxygenase n=1 Tax=Magnolia sinica TaxID=86752 RepID=UPI0026582E23|nr:flavonoid 3'-monooxygenase [Magnolia sinica]
MALVEFTLFALLLPTLVYLLVNLRTVFLKRHRLPFPPGPKGWPILGNLPQLGLVPHHSLAALARKYGPLFHLRMGSVHVVVAASSSVAAQFLKHHDANFSSRPPNSGAKHIAYNYNDLVFAPYGPRWRALRKVCAVHLFSAKALEDFRHVREEEVGKLTRALAGEPLANVGQLLNVCTTNALGRVMIGKRVFGELVSGGAHKEAGEFKEMVVELMVLAGVFNLGDFIPALDWLDLQGVARKMKKLHKRFDDFLSGIMDEHRKSGGTHTDLLSVLMSLNLKLDEAEGSGKLTDTEIKALLLDLFTAGTDTSSSTVEWALAELIRHPKILAQAQAELDSVVGSARLVSEADLANLPFLNAVIKETFRLHPSTPLSLPRIAAEDCEINGYLIPKNSTLLVNVWAIARDPAVWPEPLKFCPERFLPGSPQAHIDIRGNDFEVIPFGAGRRICAGMSLGLRMVYFMTATLVHAFNWALPEGQVAEKLNMDEAYGLTLQRAVPLTLRPLPRLEPHVYGATQCS